MAGQIAANRPGSTAGGPGRGPTRGHYPGHQRLHEGICDVEHDLVLNAKSKEEPRAQRRTNFWIAANDWP